MINCPYCGKLTDPKLDNCPHCGGYMRRAGAATGKGGGQRQTCPNCHALVQDGDIVCVNCGTNLLTGQKITEEKKVMARRRRMAPWALISVLVLVVLGAILLIYWFAYQGDAVSQARRLMGENQISAATGLLERHVQENPRDAAAQFLLGRSYWMNRQYSDAAAAFEAAADSDATNRDAFMLAALAYAHGNSASDRERAEGVLDRMVRSFPDDAEAWHLLGLVRSANGNYAQGARALEEALALDPSLARGRTFLGIAKALQRDYPDARTHLDAALNARPEDADLRAALGFVSGLEGDAPQAQEALRAAIQNNTRVKSLALTQLARHLIVNGNFSGAVEQLNQAVTADPTNQTAKFLYGISLQAVGRLDDAINTFNELSQGTGPYAADSAALAAQAYVSQQKVDRAREAINRASELGAQGPFAYTVKGRMHALAGENNAAREAFKQAIAADAQYAPAYLEYGLFEITRDQAYTTGVRKLEQYLALLTPEERNVNAPRIQELIDQLRKTGSPAQAAPAQANAQLGVVS